MDYKEVYEQWIANPYFDEATKEELKSIAEDENEIKERFYMDLEFGTAGLRGIIGAGTNRMNIYVVRRATQGLANYIAKVDKKSQGVAIAYDSRHMSPEFAQEAALCLAANGTMETKYTGRTVHRSHRHMTAESWEKLRQFPIGILLRLWTRLKPKKQAFSR